MNNIGQNRRRVLNVEGLESRELLSANLARLSAAEVSAFAGSLPRLIVGVVSGPNVFTNADAGTDTYHLSGKAAGVGITLVGGDSFSSTQINSRSFRDTYTNGSLTLTAAGGSTVAITYSGTGASPVSGRGLFTATFHGTAVYTSGIHTGLKYAFTATIRGDELTDTTAQTVLTFNLRR